MIYNGGCVYPLKFINVVSRYSLQRCRSDINPDEIAGACVGTIAGQIPDDIV